MQEPSNSDPVPPPEAVNDISQDTIAHSSVNEESPLADEPLNRMERIAANWGTWIITVVERWHLQSAPSFAVDDHPIADLLEPIPSPTDDGPTAPMH